MNDRTPQENEIIRQAMQIIGRTKSKRKRLAVAINAQKGRDARLAGANSRAVQAAPAD